MLKTMPSNTALLVSKAVRHPPLNAIMALRSLEDTYAVGIHITHTGASVRAYRGSGKVLFCTGNPTTAKGPVSRGPVEVADQRRYTVELLHWARENMPTAEVRQCLDRLTGMVH